MVCRALGWMDQILVAASLARAGVTVDVAALAF